MSPWKPQSKRAYQTQHFIYRNKKFNLKWNQGTSSRSSSGWTDGCYLLKLKSLSVTTVFIYYSVSQNIIPSAIYNFLQGNLLLQDLSRNLQVGILEQCSLWWRNYFGCLTLSTPSTLWDGVFLMRHHLTLFCRSNALNESTSRLATRTLYHIIVEHCRYVAWYQNTPKRCAQGRNNYEIYMICVLLSAIKLFFLKFFFFIYWTSCLRYCTKLIQSCSEYKVECCC